MSCGRMPRSMHAIARAAGSLGPKSKTRVPSFKRNGAWMRAASTPQAQLRPPVRTAQISSIGG
eukprot:3507044-Prymnesium_polylepis.1